MDSSELVVHYEVYACRRDWGNMEVEQQSSQGKYVSDWHEHNGYTRSHIYSTRYDFSMYVSYKKK